MSRYFKAESINPQNDFLYQAPYELLMKGLEVQQQGYDNMLNQTDLFNQLDIKSINDPTVQKHVQSIKDMYEGRANEITSEIRQDPTKWQKTMPKLRKLAAQLRTDMTSGDIANIQGTYTNWQKFQENIKDKDKRTAAYANKYYIEEYLKMDIHTKRNLELTETLRLKQRNYSLIWQNIINGIQIKQLKN